MNHHILIPERHILLRVPPPIYRGTVWPRLKEGGGRGRGGGQVYMGWIVVERLHICKALIVILYNSIYVCLCCGFTAQSTQWGHVERGQFK